MKFSHALRKIFLFGIFSFDAEMLKKTCCTNRLLSVLWPPIEIPFYFSPNFFLFLTPRAQKIIFWRKIHPFYRMFEVQIQVAHWCMQNVENMIEDWCFSKCNRVASETCLFQCFLKKEGVAIEIYFTFQCIYEPYIQPVELC